MKKNEARSSVFHVRHFFEKLSHNWGWKLLSLVLAVCLWGGIVAQDTSLLRDKTVPNVKITVSNAAALRQSGYIVVSDLDALPTVDLRVQVPQGNYSAANNDKYSVRADLSQIKSSGVQQVPLTAQANSVSQYGTVTDLSISSIEVTVDEYAQRTGIPVQLITTGSVPGDYYAAPVSLSPSAVDVAGPRQVVDSIARCVVTYDESLITEELLSEGLVSTALRFTFQDYQGDPVDTANLTVTSGGSTLKSIRAEQNVYPMVSAKVNTANLIYGQPEEGYTVTSVTVEPETVLVALREKTEEPLVVVPIGRVNITGKTENAVQSISLFRPDNFVNLSTSVLLVTVTIEPEAQQP